MAAVQRISSILESKKNLMMHGHVSEWALVGTIPAAAIDCAIVGSTTRRRRRRESMMATGDSCQCPSDSLIQLRLRGFRRPTRLNIWQTPIKRARRWRVRVNEADQGSDSSEFGRTGRSETNWTWLQLK
jgi:hypothetical protein